MRNLYLRKPTHLATLERKGLLEVTDSNFILITLFNWFSRQFNAIEVMILVKESLRRSVDISVSVCVLSFFFFFVSYVFLSSWLPYRVFT